MARLWAKIIKKHRIAFHVTTPCEWGDVESVLTELCVTNDIPCPIWLGKHVRELDEFRQTAFLPDHFMEDVPFQRLEIEFLEDEDTKKRKSNDPRNQFDGF